jgi:hypothetical protein
MEPRGYEPFESRYLSAGILQQDFRPHAANAEPDSVAVRYRTLMPVIGFHQANFDILFGYTRYSLGTSRHSSVFLGTAASSDFPIAGRRPSALVMPILLAADFTKAEAHGAERDNFNVASIGLGTGLKYRIVTPGLDFSIFAVAIAHFSFEAYSGGTGFSGVALGEATLVLRDIRVLDGVVVGYRFRLQSWSMSDDRFSYRSLSHGPYIGVML